MGVMLEFSDRELKTTMISMLRALMEKVYSIQKQVDDVSRKMGSLRKNQKEILEIKTSVTEMKNVFYVFKSRL